MKAARARVKLFPKRSGLIDKKYVALRCAGQEQTIGQPDSTGIAWNSLEWTGIDWKHTKSIQTKLKTKILHFKF